MRSLRANEGFMERIEGRTSLFRSCTITTEVVNNLFPFKLGVRGVQGWRRSKSGDGDLRETC
jgi:hypothetical protein